MIRLFGLLKLHQKWLLAILCLILLPLMIYTYLSYTMMSDLARSQTIQLAEQTTAHAVSQLGFLTQSSINALDILSRDLNLNAMLSRDPSTSSYAEQLSDYNEIVNTAKTLERNKDIRRVILYVQDEFVYANDGINTFDMSSATAEPWYTPLVDSGASSFWFAAKGETDKPAVVSVVRQLLNLNDFNRTIGISRIDIQQDVLIRLLNQTKISEGSSVYLVNSQNRIIAHSGAEEAASRSDERAWDDIPPGTWIEAGSGSVMLSHRPIAYSDWTLVHVIPMQDILSGVTKLRNKLLGVLASIVFAAYILAYLTSRAGTRNIKLLIKRMKRVQNGDLNAIITLHDGKDEIGELVENFNFMLVQLSRLMEERVRLAAELRNAELRTLQAQINPHFLYNSLDLINCTAIEHDIADITRMVKSLTKFYKLGLSNGGNIVTLQSEIEHIQAYTQIMNMRYDDAISLRIAIDPEFLACRIPKITLQPLVENAILHGILEKESRRGRIRIACRQQSGAVLLDIADDGVGIPDERLQALPGHSESDRHHGPGGFGIRNTHDRLRLVFGEAYGLRYQSAVGQGTVVQVRFPFNGDREAGASLGVPAD